MKDFTLFFAHKLDGDTTLCLLNRTRPGPQSIWFGCSKSEVHDIWLINQGKVISNIEPIPVFKEKTLSSAINNVADFALEASVHFSGFAKVIEDSV